jgi:hypothetical protein
VEGCPARSRMAFSFCAAAALVVSMAATSPSRPCSCIRCPVLIVGSDEKPRLEEICDNLTARIAEAEREGWLGEIDGLSVSPAAAAEKKIARLNTQKEWAQSSVLLGFPTIGEVTVREAVPDRSSR